MELLIRVCLLVLVFSACDGGGGTPDGGDQGDGGGRCAQDSDCDDGRFCTGTERCAPDDSAADARGCAPGAAPCAAPLTCDESADRCANETCDPADADGDGHDAIECGGGDCDDANASRFPGASEVCDEADVDEDCDPSTYGPRDVDGDGHDDAACCNVDDDGERTCGSDCDDSESGVSPDVPEVCNGVDDDCSGAPDDHGAFVCRIGQRMACNPPDAPAGFSECLLDCTGFGLCVSEDEGPDVPRSCNGLDDDGDGTVDDNFACAQGSMRDCTSACSTAGTQGCLEDCSGFTQCVAALETCNYCDDNGVDGTADETHLAMTDDTMYFSGLSGAGTADASPSGPGAAVRVHSGALGTAGTLFDTDVVQIGYGPLVFEAGAVVSCDPSAGREAGGWTLVVARAGGATSSAGSADDLGVPSGIEGYAAFWRVSRFLSNDEGSLEAFSGGMRTTVDRHAACNSVQPCPSPALNNSSGSCMTSQEMVLTIEPDIPGSAGNEMHVIAHDGTGTVLGECTGAACPVLIQPGDMLEIGVTAADDGGNDLFVQMILGSTAAPTIVTNDRCE